MAYAFGNFTKWNTFFETIECASPYIPYLISPGNRDEKQICVERFAMPNNQYSESIPMEKRNAYWSKEYGSAYLISLSILGKKFFVTLFYTFFLFYFYFLFLFLFLFFFFFFLFFFFFFFFFYFYFF